MKRILSLVVLGLLTARVPAAGESDPPEPGTGADAYRFVLDYAAVNGGRHRTSSVGDLMVMEWLAGELGLLGLETRIDRYDFPRFEVRKLSLEVDEVVLEEGAPDEPVFPDGAPKPFPQAIDAYFWSGVTPPEGITAPLANGTEEVDGRIAVVEVSDGLGTRAQRNAMRDARGNGALGVVMAVQGPGNYVVGQNADSRGGLCEIPTVIVGKGDGDRLQAMAGRTATFVLDAAYLDGTGGSPFGELRNAWGMLRGVSEETIVVGTPMNGLFATGAERGAGIGVLLTLARYYAARTAADGPLAKTLVFVGTGGHEAYGLGLDYFFRDVYGMPFPAPAVEKLDRALTRSKITVYLHLGASVAASQFEAAGGEPPDDFEPTGDPETSRLLFVSENPFLEGIAERAIRTHLGYQVVTPVPPAAFDPGEQQSAYVRGIPMIGISGSNQFQHTPRDLVDATSAVLLGPVVAAYRQMIDDLLDIPGDVVRLANIVAAAPPDVNVASAYVVQECP